MSIADIHTHILPAIDDGAKDVDVSLELLSMMRAQGIDRVVATPHFYAGSTNIEKFTAARNTAYDSLKRAAEERNIELPQIKLGAEVYYFNGIGTSGGVRALTLGDSDYMLLELQNAPVTDLVVRDILNLYNSLGIFPVLAHLERFVHERGFEKIIELIEDDRAYAQVNADTLLDSSGRRTASKLIKRGLISFIATDTHSVRERPPRMAEALEAAGKKFGEEQQRDFIENGVSFFEEL